MCFAPKVPKFKAPETPQIQQTTPVTDTPAATQSGADQATVAQQKKKTPGSLFQIDLTIPTGSSSGTSTPAGNGVNNTGAAVR